jgi:hypothetical protein
LHDEHLGCLFEHAFWHGISFSHFGTAAAGLPGVLMAHFGKIGSQ